ncbi:MAG: tetratricopeptide repeat protein [Hyphomicrobiaceae bacterium]
MPAGQMRGSFTSPAPPSEPVLSTDQKLDAADTAFAAGDYDTALSYWVELAHAGNPIGQRSIGQCFLQAKGIEKNVELALKWLKLSAESGDAEGQRQLAEFYFKGEDGFPNEVEAKAWYRRAAVQGNASAQDMLSWMLAEDDANPNHTEAREWALRAANQGVASSMTRLGLLYHNALGVERDPVQAALWWERAAYRDDGDAQAMLGAAYHLGSGRPRDPVEALTWLKRARVNKSPFADRFFEAVTTSCTNEQRSEASRRAALKLELATFTGGLQ